MATDKTPQSDAVDRIREQWRQERPELDTNDMALLGRLGRCAALLQKRLGDTFSRFGLCSWEFDALATLHRSGPPYCLAPTALHGSLMISSGTMTRQLQLLAERGLIVRQANPDDARSLLVQLTPEGLALINEAVSAHVGNMAAIVAPLPPESYQALDSGLRQLLAVLEAEDRSR